MQSLVEIFRQRNITEVTIVDDSFDPPLLGDDDERIEDFWDSIEGDVDALKELSELGFKVERSSDIGNDLLKVLYDDFSRMQYLKAAYEKNILPIVNNKREAALDKLCCFFQELGIRYHCVGGEDNLLLNESSIFFVDYYLGPVSDKTAAKRKSVATVRKIIEDSKGRAEKPLVVLMSSFPEDVTDSVRANFRADTGLISGMFYFLGKTELLNRVRLTLKLEAIASSLPLRHEIQQFIDSLTSAVEYSVVKFVGVIRELSLEDYAYIQRLSLIEDGRPLGDYISWLFSSYFGHLLFDMQPNVKIEQNKLNRLIFSELPLFQYSPSDKVNDLYGSALFATVENIGKHPLTAPGESNTYLHIGDVFIGIADKILMVISAQCDLAFSPVNPQRRFKHDQSVLFIPGLLVERSGPANDTDIVTDLLIHEGRSCRIQWDIKNVMTLKYGKAARWLNEKGYERKYRLRLPYALFIQNAFATNLMRIGLPVAPPVSRPAKTIVYYRDVQNEVGVLLKSDIGVYVTVTPNDTIVTFTEPFIIELNTALHDASEGLRISADAILGDEVRKKRRLKYALKLASLTDVTPMRKLWKSHSWDTAKLSKRLSPIRVTENMQFGKEDDIGESVLINVKI